MVKEGKEINNQIFDNCNLFSCNFQMQLSCLSYFFLSLLTDLMVGRRSEPGAGGEWCGTLVSLNLAFVFL